MIDWEIGFFGKLTETLNQLSQSHNKQESKFILHFEKFVKFIIYEIESNSKSYGSLHWWPYTRLCNMCHIRYDFIGKVETWQSDVELLIESGNFSEFEKTALCNQKLNQNQQKTTEDTSKLYFKQLSPELVIKLYNLYKNDFIIGGYDYPQSYVEVAKKNKTENTGLT